MSWTQLTRPAKCAGSTRAPARYRITSSTQALVTFVDPSYNIRPGSTFSITGIAKKAGLNVCLLASVRAC